MTDVRLVATNPDDGVLVPVASNASGQLAVQSPKIEKIPNDVEVEGTVTANKFVGDGSSLSNLPSAPPPTPPFDGNLDGDLSVSGDGTFQGLVGAEGTSTSARLNPIGQVFVRSEGVAVEIRNVSDPSNIQAQINGNGSAEFDGEVVIGSKGAKWLIRESNGVAMLIPQETREQIEPGNGEFQKVRDLPRELDLVEAALNEIMGKLKMTPPAGWEVWDGSDNSQ